MSEVTQLFFSKLVGTLAVILVISFFAGSTSHLNRFVDIKNWKSAVVVGILGGLFGIYGNISGVDFHGALITVRDIGPMLSGFMAGPIGGVISGAIAGLHRLAMGGLTAPACVVATCTIGLCCGLLGRFVPNAVKKPYWSLLVGASMEIMHLCIVLLMVRPLETALDIVKQIALPFVLVNSVGLTLMVSVILYMERQRQFTLERNRLRAELEIANVIQHSLLPTIDDAYPGRNEVDVCASMEAAKEVGGDFYDAFFLDSSHIAFVVGDVSGKGVPAALFMVSSKTILQNCIRDISSLSTAIETANLALCKRNEADMFVTVWAGVLDLKTGLLTYVSAGHNPPVHMRGGKASFIPSKSGFVLGGLEGVRYKEQELQLQIGDTVFLFTDGVTEATSDSKEQFGEDRLIRAMEEAEDDTAAGILDSVRRSIDEFVRENDQFDDITMLCFRLKGLGRSDLNA